MPFVIHSSKVSKRKRKSVTNPISYIAKGPSGQRAIAPAAITQDEAHVSRRDRTIESLIDLIDCICARWRLHMLNRQLYRAGSVAVCPADSYVTRPPPVHPHAFTGIARACVHVASSTRALAQRLALTGTYDHHDDDDDEAGLERVAAGARARPTVICHRG